MQALSIGIIGAGTAGLAAAIAFARDGHAVQVFEKHPSLATLGAGVLIQPQGVAAIDALGLGAAFASVSVPIDRLLGTCERGWPLVDIRYRDLAARAVSRSALGQVLLQAAHAAGAQIRFATPIDGIAVENGRAVITAGAQREHYDLLVIANGASSTLPAQSGLAIAASKYAWGALWAMFDLDHWPREALLEQRYAGTRKMYGIMPTERIGNKLRVSFFWSLPCAAYGTWQATPIKQWKAELLALWPESAPLVEQIRTHEQFAFASYYHARPSKLASPPVCIVGDAAHAMSPQLGLGSTLAVQDALALARHVKSHGAVVGALRYSRRRLPAVRAYQTLSRMLTPCFQADGAGLWRDLMFAASLKIPGVPYLMYRSIAAPTRCIQSAADPAGIFIQTEK